MNALSMVKRALLGIHILNFFSTFTDTFDTILLYKVQKQIVNGSVKSAKYLIFVVREKRDKAPGVD